jgi:hypothetical protein
MYCTKLKKILQMRYCGLYFFVFTSVLRPGAKKKNYNALMQRIHGVRFAKFCRTMHYFFLKASSHLGSRVSAINDIIIKLLWLLCVLQKNIN